MRLGAGSLAVREYLEQQLKKKAHELVMNTYRAMARVKLEQTLDFDEADRLAKKALGVNPTLGGAYAVLAGIALRDMELAEAEKQVAAGLKYNPRDLELLSMRAAARFLADVSLLAIFFSPSSGLETFFTIMLWSPGTSNSTVLLSRTFLMGGMPQRRTIRVRARYGDQARRTSAAL